LAGSARARARVLIAGAIVLLAAAPAPAADPVAAFYAGKTVKVIVGYSVGGGYDIYARALARHLGRHIPGEPVVVPQNMPGAGSLRAANYLYAAAPKDGTVLATFARGLATERLLGRGHGNEFDATRFNWIGSVTDETSVCVFSRRSGIKTWADMQARPFTVGGTGAVADTDVFPNVLRNLFHVPLKLVTGFPGGADLVLALERGEIDGRCGWSWSSLMSRDKALYDRQEIYVPLQLALHRNEHLPDTPLILDLARDAREAAALTLILARQRMARPFAAPPDVPAARVAALRAAFDATMTDPAFLAEAAKLELEVRPVGGADMQALVAELHALPPDVVALAADAIKSAP
jgi:tripartite-type tricarboxylate transporter receptor subunit TctC